MVLVMAVVMVLSFFTSADFDLLLLANVQGCGAQTLQSELLPDDRAFTMMIMVMIKMMVVMLKMMKVMMMMVVA